MGQVIQFPMNDLMANYEFGNQYEEYYAEVEEELYFLNQNEQKKETCLSKLARKFFCR